MVNYWLAKQEPSGPRAYNFEQLKKEIKEQQQIIEDLQARITALESE